MKQKNAQLKAKTHQNGAQLQKITKSKGPMKPAIKKEKAKGLLLKPVLKKEEAKGRQLKSVLKKEEAKNRPLKPVLNKEVVKIVAINPPKKAPAQKKGNKKQLTSKKIEPQSEEDDDEDNELESKVKMVVIDRKKKSSAIDDNSDDNIDGSDDDDESDGAGGENTERADDDSNDESENADSVDNDSNDEVENEESADEDSNDDGENGESDDEEPIEVPNPKKSKSSVRQDSPQKINPGMLPKDIPDEQVVVVTNLPASFKQIDIVEVFAKYGTLHTINPRYKPNGNTSAFVAFTTADAAQMALAENQKATIKGQTIKVSIKRTNLKKEKEREEKELIEQSADRTMLVKKVKADVTEEHLREHFAPCGTIERIKIVQSKPYNFAFVVYTDAASVEPATKLNNTILCGGTIFVKPKNGEFTTAVKSSLKTICLKNKQNLEALSGDTLNKIFDKCGEIDNVHILCKKNTLAFVTFKNESDAEKALKLNGTTVAGIELDIEKFKDNFGIKTSIFVYNVKPGVTEEEIRDLFAVSGEINNVVIHKGYAIVRFENVDGFCKSFLQNEAILQGQMVFLEPLSDKKQQFVKRNNNRHPIGRQNLKRPFPKHANTYPKPGNGFPKSGKSFPKHANTYPKPGNTFPKHTNNYPKPGNTFPKHTNNYPKPGNTFPKHTNSNPKHGNGFPKRQKQED